MDLKEFFTQYKKTALAFSGGTDSAYLMYAAKTYAEDVRAYYLNSPFQPEFELNDALRLSNELGVELKVINADLNGKMNILKNSSLRCYYCKKNLFEILIKTAKADGYDIIIDGTNASDLEADRPGMRALKEAGVLSPLKMCELTKSDIRFLSKQAGLFTYNKPTYSCLATRIPTGMPITQEMLSKIERAESCLFSLGFSDFRFRIINEKSAKIQVKKEQFEKALDSIENIREELKNDFSSIYVDKEVFR